MQAKFVYSKTGELFVGMRYHMDCGLPKPDVKCAGWFEMLDKEVFLFGESYGYGIGIGSEKLHPEIIQKIKEFYKIS